mgnify:CR=1 FL=1
MNDQMSVVVYARIFVQTADQVSPDKSAKPLETPAKETPMSGASVRDARAETERIFGIIILLHQTH